MKDAELRRDSVALFYYSGHSIQVNYSNYMVPVRAKIYAEDEVEDECLKISSVTRKMDTAETYLNIIILDTGFDMPLGRGISITKKGLSNINATPGSIVSYSTGQKTDNNIQISTRNTLYTSILLDKLQIPGMEIGDIFKEVRKETIYKSNGKQTPWESSSLTSEFYFKAGENVEYRRSDTNHNVTQTEGKGRSSQFSWGIGVKYWRSDWDIGISEFEGENVEINGGGDLIGPALKLSYNRFFAGASYLTSLYEYDFGLPSSDLRQAARGAGQDWQVDRHDTEIILGYMLHRNFGIVAGYKIIESESTINGDEHSTVDYDFNVKINGPAFGICSNYAFGNSKWIATLTAAYMPIMTYDHNLYSGDANGYSVEAGISYRIFKSINLSLGYKYQTLEIEYDQREIEDEWTFSGITLDLSYYFGG